MVPRSPSGIRSWLRREWVLLVVSAVAVLATAVRLYGLGRRVFYYDEAWIGYWVLTAAEHGVWHYRPILHGPFFARVNPPVFSMLGVDDASARLVVALVGGLLALSAWLFRERLRDSEVVALALLLAGTPVLVYYSRFMRNDVPLAAFALVTVGFAVRLLDTGRPRYLYGGALSLGLAFTTKESVLLYLVTWLGAGTLVVDDRLVRSTATGEAWRAVASGWIRTAACRVRSWVGHLAGATLLFVAVVVYFYAPRPALWTALGDPSRLPSVVWTATVGSFLAAVDFWVTGSIQDHAYLPYLADTLSTLAAGAPAVSVLAVLGVVVDRYGGDHRDLVAFSFYSGVAAVLGYPLANNFPVPWSTVHAVVPLTIPAAVGAGAVYRWGRGRLTTATMPSNVPSAAAVLRAGIAAAVLLAAVGNAGLVVVETSYRHPHASPADGGSELVYNAQAPGNLTELTVPIRRAAERPGNGTDVLFVGPSLSINESADERPSPPPDWYARIPLQWYTAAADADVESVADPWILAVIDPPPVVITAPGRAEEVAERLPAHYEQSHHPLDGIGDRAVVAFVANRSRSP